MDFMSEKYSDTRAALRDLQSALLCHGCKTSQSHQENTEKEMFSFGICEHRFCRPCLKKIKGSMCPVCSMPFRSTNVKIDKQLSNIAALCLNFWSIVSGETEEQDREACILNNLDKRNSEASEVVQVKPPPTEVFEFQLEKTPAQSLDETATKGQRRSERLTPLKDQPMNKNNMTKPETPGSGRKRTVSSTPSSSYKAKVKSQGTKQNTPRGRKAFSNTIQPDPETKEKQTDTPINIGKRGVRSHSARKSINKTAYDDEENSSDKNKEVKADKAGAIIPFSSSACERDSDHSLVKHQFCPAQKKNAAHLGTPNSKGRGNQALLEKRNAKGETRLQVAALKADLEKVQELLAEGANPNVKDNAGWTPLHEAVNHGNVRIAELLLNHGASVNAPGLENDTPLHDAVTNYNMECVQLLVKRGANVMARNTHGQTALDMAKTEDMREALLLSGGTIIVPEEDAFMGEDVPVRPCFVTSSLSKEEQLSAQKCSKLFDAKLVENHCPEVTHSIHGVNAEGLCPRTLKYLNAILCGTWIVTSEWMSECLTQSERIAEEAFEIPGCTTTGKCNAPQRARLNRLRKLPGLFDGCQFYFHGKFCYPTPSKEELTKIAKSGGGAILTREPRQYNLDDYPYTVPYHAASTSSLSDCAIFVIYDDSCRNPSQVESQRMSYLPASWLLDSVAAFALLEKNDYLKH